MNGWIDDVNEKLTVQEAVRLTGRRTGRHDSFGPCPACNADKRGAEDRRGPCGARRDGKGWHCFACEASGDAAELLALVWQGARMRELTREQRQALHDRCAEQGLCNPAGSPPVRVGAPAARARPAASRAAPDPGWRVRQAGEPTERAEPEPPAAGAGPFDWQPDLPERCEAALWAPEGAQVLAYLQGRGFLPETLRHWKFGAHLLRRGGRVVEQYVALPVPRRDGKVVNMRFRSVPGPCLHCEGAGCERCKSKGQVGKVYLRCTGAPTTLFGVHQLDSDANSEVVITEGELDVVALWQYGLRTNVVSGTAGAGTWEDSWLDQLEPYRSFVLAYDTDDKGDAGADKVAKALGLDRCSRATLPRKDAGQCLEDVVSQREVQAAIDNAASMLGVKLARVGAYTDELERMIEHPEELRGATTGSEKLDKALGGWAPGLVVVTGDTAAGKTSFATWCALEQTLRGQPALITSFEQRPIGSVQKLLRAKLGGSFLKRTKEERRAAMQALDVMPMFILDHYGELNAQQLMQALSYARRRKGVRFALVDHLGFLVRDAEDERRAIEDAVRSMALFAVQNEMTVLLICHPNNLAVVQQRRVMLGDLKGASAIRQDAHCGLVVERLLPGKMVKHPAAAVHCDKVRSEFGIQGARVTMFYDPEACVYADTWEATPMGARGETGGFPVPAEGSTGTDKRSRRERANTQDNTGE